MGWSRWAAAILAVLLLDCGGRTGNQPAGSLVTLGPYLQNVKPEGITLMWETDGGGQGLLEYGTSSGYGSQVLAAAGVPAASRWVNRATLSGLQAGTTYHYRVTTSAGSTADATFRTAPDTEQDFSFGVWGDSQGLNPDNPAEPLEPTRIFMQDMVQGQKVDLAITTGDLAENGDYDGDVRSFFLQRPVQIIGTRVPFFVAWGNHDGTTGALIRRYTDLPSKDRPGMGPGFGAYAFDYAGCHFICMDDALVATEVPGWLQQELQSPATRKARFTFVFIHRAPWYDRWYEGEAWLRTSMAPFLEQARVAICFSGHVHAYERGAMNNVAYVTTGGGSWLDTAAPLVADWPNITVGGWHNDPPALNHGLVNGYVKVEIKGNLCTAKMFGFSADGTPLGVLDSFQTVSANR